MIKTDFVSRVHAAHGLLYSVSRKRFRRLRKISLLILAAMASSLFVAVAFSGCGRVSELGTQLAQDAGLISSEEAASVNRSTQAIEKTRQNLSAEEEHYLGRSVAAQVFKSYTPLDQPEANAYLNLLGQSLAVFSDRPETFSGYRFMLLDSEEVNAFAAPGGLILVTRGMVRCCENEDELAAVLAHEIAHVQHLHGVRAIKQGRLTEALTIVAAESAKQFGDDELASITREFEGLVSDVVMTLTTSGYSRKQEKEADESAIALLRQAGYSEMAMISMLNRMNERLVNSGGLGFAKTHPSAASRATAARKIVQDAKTAPDIVRQQRFAAAMGSVIAGG